MHKKTSTRVFILFVNCVALLYLAHLTLAQQNSSPPLRVELTVTENPIMEGVEVIWYVTLIPNQTIQNLLLRPGLDNNWVWLNDVPTVATLTNTQVVEISAAPQVTGELTPSLVAEFTTEDSSQSIFASSVKPVTVKPITDYIVADMSVLQGFARMGYSLPLEVSIENLSPVTITITDVIRSGSDLAWDEQLQNTVIPSGNKEIFSFSPRVAGKNPQPMVTLKYNWINAQGETQTDEISIKGELIQLSESLFNASFWAAIIGVIVGGFVTFGTQWLKALDDRRQQRKRDREQVCGILTRMCLRAEYAAASGSEMNINLFETVFETGGLHSVAQDFRLLDSIQTLWSAAESHNDGLQQPGGLERSKALHDAAQRLKSKLKSSSICRN
jgi:hypothetical protein